MSILFGCGRGREEALSRYRAASNGTDIFTGGTVCAGSLAGTGSDEAVEERAADTDAFAAAERVVRRFARSRKAAMRAVSTLLVLLAVVEAAVVSGLLLPFMACSPTTRVEGTTTSIKEGVVAAFLLAMKSPTRDGVRRGADAATALVCSHSAVDDVTGFESGGVSAVDNCVVTDLALDFARN